MSVSSARTRIGRIELANPVLLASGPAGYGLEYAGLVDLGRLGGVVTKTITFQPRGGNPGRRLQETSGGLLNSIGLENVGAARFFAEKLPALLKAGITPVVSLAAEDWDDFLRLLEAAARQEEVGIVELNLSCPNVAHGGLAVGANPDLLARYVRQAKETLGARPVIAKLTPNVADITVLALAAERAGADAITAINTVLGMDIDISCSRPVFKRVRAGLSGPAIMPIALDAVWRVAGSVKIPVLASGGITSVADAVKFFMAGAAAVQIGTAVFYDPSLPAAIVDWLEEHGLPAPIR